MLQRHRFTGAILLPGDWMHHLAPCMHMQPWGPICLNDVALLLGPQCAPPRTWRMTLSTLVTSVCCSRCSILARWCGPVRPPPSQSSTSLRRTRQLLAGSALFHLLLATRKLELRAGAQQEEEG
jgi:hypothetical protein